MDAQIRLLCGTSWVVKRCRKAITSAGMACENAGSPSVVVKPLLEAMQQVLGSQMKRQLSTSLPFASSTRLNKELCKPENSGPLGPTEVCGRSVQSEDQNCKSLTSYWKHRNARLHPLAQRFRRRADEAWWTWKMTRKNEKN